MFNELPFPHITATDVKDQIKQINDYLVCLKESLEFLLMNISADNLSPELINRLNALGVDIKNADKEEETQQMTNRILSVTDVLTSEEYKKERKKIKAEVIQESTEVLQANLETGALEYKEEVE